MAGVSDPPATATAAPTNAASPAVAAAEAPAPAAPAASADQKKDRKPRRERLPLPDPIPSTPVKRYPEPSKADLQERVDAEDKKIQACFDKLDSTRHIYDEMNKVRDAGKPAFDAARKAFNELNDQCRVLFEQRKEISAKLKAIKEADFAARSASGSGASELVGAGKDGNEALKGVRNMDDLERRISELRHRQEHESPAIQEEKRLVSQISFLTNKGRQFINSKEASYQSEKAAKEQRVIERKDLEEKRNKLDAEIDAAKAKLDGQRKVVDKVRADQDAKIKKLQSTTADIDRDAERKKINELKTVVRKLRDNFQDELDKWYLNERIHYEQQKIAKRKKYEAAQAEREKRRQEWEAEQAQYPEPDPYQEEKDMCNGLIVYLRTLLGEAVEKPSINLAPGKGQSAPSLKTTSNTREITSEGKAIGKSSTALDSGFENLLFSDFVKKSGKKGRKGRKSATPAADASAEVADTPLKPHSIDYIAAFSALDITPPNRIGEVRTALEAVEGKKAYYDSKPKPTDEEKAQMAAEKSKKQSASGTEKKPKAKAPDLMNGDAGAAFPGLGTDKAATSPSANVSVDPVGPKYTDILTGAAAAPPPPQPQPQSLPVPEQGGLDEVANEATVEGVEGTSAVNDGVNEDPLVAGPDATATNA